MAMYESQRWIPSARRNAGEGGLSTDGLGPRWVVEGGGGGGGRVGADAPPQWGHGARQGKVRHQGFGASQAALGTTCQPL